MSLFSMQIISDLNVAGCLAPGVLLWSDDYTNASSGGWTPSIIWYTAILKLWVQKPPWGHHSRGDYLTIWRSNQDSFGEQFLFQLSAFLRKKSIFVYRYCNGNNCSWAHIPAEMKTKGFSFLLTQTYSESLGFSVDNCVI